MNDPEGPLGPRRPRLWTGALLAVAVLAVTLALRQFLIEPAAIAHACDPAPWTGACAARTLVIMSFVNQEVGWAALAAGMLATLLRSTRFALGALAAGSAGLVLYSYEPAAVGLLLGMLVLVRTAAQADSANIEAA
jgi:hypothetical protein